MGGALSEALVELVEQRTGRIIGRGALGLSLQGRRGKKCLHQRETGRAQGARRPLPAVLCRSCREGPGPSSAGADGPGPEQGRELLLDHTHMLQRARAAGSSVGRSCRQTSSRAGRPGHSICACGRCGAARRGAGYGHDEFQIAPDTIMVSKRVALARTVLKAALLVLEELNIG